MGKATNGLATLEWFDNVRANAKYRMIAALAWQLPLERIDD